MALIERKENFDFFDQSPLLYVKVDNTNSDTIQEKNLTCEFCMQELKQRGYGQIDSGLVLCKSCLSYLASLQPVAKQAIERVLLGNVV